MRIALFTGTAYRHVYFANSVAEHYNIDLHVRMKRSNKITDEVGEVGFPYSDYDKKLLQSHSQDRLNKEKEYFLPKAGSFKEAKQIIEVESEDLNGLKVVEAARKANPEVVLIYGVHLIKGDLFSVLPKEKINLHAGLSPYYRGGAALYWPIYFMEPQFVGFTFHLIVPQIDHGSIVHQNRPEIFPDDGIHDLACRTIIKASEDILGILKKIETGQIKYYPQKSMGKIFYNKDFKPHHLRVTNYLMEQGLLKEYLENRSYFPDPKIISQI